MQRFNTNFILSVIFTPKCIPVIWRVLLYCQTVLLEYLWLDVFLAYQAHANIEYTSYLV